MKDGNEKYTHEDKVGTRFFFNELHISKTGGGLVQGLLQSAFVDDLHFKILKNTHY